MKCTHPQASSEIDEVADEKDTRPGRLFSRLFVHHRSGIAHPSTPSSLVTDETGRRTGSTRREYFYIDISIDFVLLGTIKLNFYYRDCIRSACEGTILVEK